MNQCLYEGKAQEVGQMTIDALAAGRPVQEILNEGLIAGMSVVGEDFKHNVIYVPEVLIAARAMKAGMGVLKPLLSAKDSTTRPAGVLLMGTMRGTLQDIEKNLMLTMARTKSACRCRRGSWSALTSLRSSAVCTARTITFRNGAGARKKSARAAPPKWRVR